MAIEKKRFEANISELMNMIIHSFYSNRDIFLRELISNASDAIDKQRHSDLQNSVLNKTYGIRIDPLTQEGCLIIDDDGIGMDEKDLVDHLSTIATSGTKEFVKNLQEKSDQIGQFGVGFYSAFLVSDRVDVITRKSGGSVYKWTSDADQYYSIEKLDDESCGFKDRQHGTKIVLHLKDSSYLEESALRRIVNQHSSFITHPIELYVAKEVETEKETVAEGTEGSDIVQDQEETDGQVEEVEDENGSLEQNKKEKEIIYEWEKLNSENPIWYQKPGGDISDEEYGSLYKTLSKDWDKPLYWRHFQTEGNYEFKGILYIPSHMPFDLLGDRSRDKRNIKLYVKKVLVLNELDKEMLPDWMNFVCGVVDCADLPLNVSREMLQQTSVIKTLKSQLKKQVMNMMNEMFADATLYGKFYETFHRHVKLGIHEGDESLMGYLLLKNSENDDLVSIDRFLEGKDDQKAIYYITGPNPKENSLVHLYRSKGYQVLFFDEPIDEFMLQRVSKYKDHDLINISKEHVTPWSSSQDPELENEWKSFVEWVKTTLNDSTIENVRLSNLLCETTADPLCVLSSKWGWTGNMEKIMKAQPLGDPKSMGYMASKKIIEINPNHPLIQNLKQDHVTDPAKSADTLGLLYRCGKVSAGFPLEDTNIWVKDIYRLLQTA